MSAPAEARVADATIAEDAQRCLGRFFAWGAAPTVDAYCDLFAPDATLLDADMEHPIRGDEIRASITRVLTLLPDFRFAPVRVYAEGPHVFVLAANRASLGERALAWDAVYALTLAGDRIRAGRRYYDRAALLNETATFAADVAAAPRSHSRGDEHRGAAAREMDLAARTAAWNRRDVRALAAPLGDARLHLSGLAAPLERRDDVATALGCLLARAADLSLEPRAVARGAGGTAIEWVGSVGPATTRRRLAMVELLPAPTAGVREWRLVFDTLGL